MASVGARTCISNCPFGHGAYFSLHAPPGRNFRAATCFGVRRRSVRTAVHPGASSCCTVDTAASRWVAAAQYSILPTPVATTTETPPANVLIMPTIGREGAAGASSGLGLGTLFQGSLFLFAYRQELFSVYFKPERHYARVQVPPRQPAKAFDVRQIKSQGILNLRLRLNAIVE